MRTCPKCGSYVPEGKILCPACGRLNVGVSENALENLRSERSRLHTQILEAQEEERREAWSIGKQKNPYQGHTYEQHKSHDPGSKDYYRPKYEASSDQSEQIQNLICAAAYFGFFFFLPLVLMPNSEKGKFHANQGLVLFVLNIVVGALGSVLSAVMGSFFEIMAVIPPLLMVYGAANAFKGDMTELPIVGKIQLIKDDDMFGGRRGL